MQIPKRRSDKLKKPDTGLVYLTKAGLKKLKRTIAWLEQELPEAIAEVARTKEYGDFSENAEYKEAKYKMRKIRRRIFYLKERLNRVELIDPARSKSGIVELGSTVVVVFNGSPMTFQILGTYESSPSQGRISNTSPLGRALIGHVAGDEVKLQIKGEDIIYQVLEVNP